VVVVRLGPLVPIETLRGFDSRRLPFPASEPFLDRNGSLRTTSIGIVVRGLLAPDLSELVLEVGGRALDVDVRGRVDVGMA
jgi:hypothetical protein